MMTKMPTFREVIEKELLKRIGFFVRTVWAGYERIVGDSASLEYMLMSLKLKVNIGRDLYEYLLDEEGINYVGVRDDRIFARYMPNTREWGVDFVWSTDIEYIIHEQGDVGEAYMSFGLAVSKDWKHREVWLAVNN